MNILIMSELGDGYSLATRLASEKNDVKMWIKKKEHRIIGMRISNPEIINEWNPYLKWAEFIIFDMVKQGKLADRFKKMGKIVLGASEFADKIELNRIFGQEIMTSTKATITDYQEFTSLKDGIKFLSSVDKGYVFKAHGNTHFSWTFVPKNDDNNATISFMENLPVDDNIEFMLQQKVDGIEISTEGWFNGNEFVNFNHTFEKKRLMENDKGPNTGCMGNVVWVIERDKITDYLLTPLVPILKKHNYIGPIDVNVIADEKHLYFLEFTARFGYDAIQALLMLTQNITGFLYNVASGHNQKQIFSDDYSLAVNMKMPPAPHSIDVLKELKGLKVLEIPEFLNHYIWLSDMMLNNKSEVVIAGTDGVIGTVVATNSSIDGAREFVYDMLDEILISKDVQYRCDIGKDVKENIEKLIKWGWLNEKTF